MPSSNFFKNLEGLKLTDDNKSVVIFVGNLITPLLHWIPRGIPEYTDHGILHSSNVLRNVRNLVTEYPVTFTEDEKYILALSAILHDIGCLIGRDSHNEKSIKILSKPQFETFRIEIGSLFYRALQVVIIAHSKNYDLNKIPADPSPDIRLKFISAIFRLADAIDVNALRVKELLLEILVDENLLDNASEAIWRSHLEIENILIEKNILKPQIYDITVAKHCLDELEKELSSINPILSKLNYPVFLLEPEIIEKDSSLKP